MTTIVWGANHYNTLGLIRSLGEAGHKVILLLKKERMNYADKSKYVKECIYLDESTDIISLIKSIASQMGQKLILFCTGDQEATFIDAHYEELNQYIIAEGGICDNDINNYRDKTISNKLAMHVGLEVPMTWSASTPTHPADIEYPVIVKANNSIHGGKSVMRVCHNENELVSHLKSIPPDDYPLQIQKFIKKEYEIMLQGCSVKNGERCFCRIANRKKRHYPDINGLGTYSFSVDIDSNPTLIELRKKISLYLQAIKYSGLFSAEFVYSNGHYYFMEVNLRNDATSYLSTACGVNLPDIYCRSISGKEISFSYNPCFYMNVIPDLHHVKKHSVSFYEWLSQFRKTHCFSHFNKNDMMPYFFYMIKSYKSIIRLFI